MRVDNHQHDERQQEHNRQDNGDAIKVFLDNTRTSLRGVYRAGDHVRNPRALTRVQQDEYDKANARDDEQRNYDNEERIQGSSLFFLNSEQSLYKLLSIANHVSEGKV